MNVSSFLELLAIVSGITSVWYSRKESILVYPTGLLNTIIYVYLSFRGDLFGEVSVNVFYTVMSLYGWINWLRKDDQHKPVVKVAFSTKREWFIQLGFFLVIFFLIYLLLSYIKSAFAPGAIPWADALASASAFTGMWLMTQKKVESWYWWIITNISAIPLYFVKGYAFTSGYYLILLVLAITGLIEWRKRAVHG